MRRCLLVTMLVVCSPMMLATASGSDVQSLKSVKVEFPESDRQFPGGAIVAYLVQTLGVR